MDETAKSRQVILLQSRLPDASKLKDFLASYADRFNIPEETYNDLRLAVEETFINIASYAYKKDVTRDISVELINAGDEISITFTDSGIAFNPLTISSDNIASDDHRDGGMGIHLIRSLTDRQEYSRVGQTNVFTLTKHYTNK